MFARSSVLVLAATLLWATACARTPDAPARHGELGVAPAGASSARAQGAGPREAKTVDFRGRTYAVTCRTLIDDLLFNRPHAVDLEGKSILGYSVDGVSTNQAIAVRRSCGTWSLAVLERYVGTAEGERIQRLVDPRPGFDPKALAFWNEHRGLLVGELCAGRTSEGEECEGLIQRTVDGGETWRAIQRWSQPLGTVTVLGRRRAWVSIGPCETGLDRCHPPSLLFTRNGGKTWRRITRDPVFGMSFGSATVGWAQGPVRDKLEPWPIFRSTDGGVTWHWVPNPCRSIRRLASVSFVSESHGRLLCIGEGGGFQEPKRIMETTDGGATWRPLGPVYGPGGLGTGGYAYGMFFFPDGRGWMYGGLLLDRSEDGGRTWAELGLPFGTFTESLWFTDPEKGFALVRTPFLRLVRTDDGGTTWTHLRSWA